MLGKHYRFESRSLEFLTQTTASQVRRTCLRFPVVLCAKPCPFRRRHHLRFTQKQTDPAVCFVVKNGIVFMWRKWRTFFQLSEPIRSHERQRCEFRPIGLRLPMSMERNSNADRNAIEVLRMNEKIRGYDLNWKKKKKSRRNVAFISQSSLIQDFCDTIWSNALYRLADKFGRIFTSSGLLPKPVEILTYALFWIVWVCVDEYPQGSTSLES